MGWAGKYRYGVQHHGTYYAVKPTAGRRVHRRAHPSTSTKTYQQYHPLHTSVVHVTVDRYLHAKRMGNECATLVWRRRFSGAMFASLFSVDLRLHPRWT